MAIVTFRGPVFLPAPWVNSAGPGSPSVVGNSSTTIDAVDEVYGYVLRAPKTGNLRAVQFLMDTVTTGATITIGAYAVDDTTGFPSDVPTALGTDSFITKAIATTDANDWVSSGNFTADVAVTKGQRLAICFINPGASAGNMRFAAFIDFTSHDENYLVLYTGTWARTKSFQPILLLVYDDGSVAIPNGAQALGTSSAVAFVETAIGTGSTPDVMGARFKVPGPLRVTGAWTWVEYDGDANIKLVTADWDGGSTGLLATATVDSNCRVDLSDAIHVHEFDVAVELAADTWYRLVVEPSSATTINVWYYAVEDATVLGAQPLGVNWHLTTAKDPNDNTDWTNYDNATDGFRVFLGGLLIDGVSDGAAAGGGGGPLIGGRLVL